MSGALRRKRKAQRLQREAAYAAERKATTVGGWGTPIGRTQEGALGAKGERVRVTRNYRGPAGPVTVYTFNK
ncbi:MAG: hypothetical protein ACO3O3_07120 [Ilumatobacteraceae bacterium]